MPRPIKITIAILLAAVVAGLIYLRSLHRRVARLEQNRASEEQERREVVAPPVSTPTDVNVQAEIYWASATNPDKLEPVEVQLPLSADPVERSKQLIGALVANPPTPEQRTLPESVTLLGFYLLPNGTAVADFSDALSTETPSGILSEWMAVNSILQTLEANVPGIARLKILIQGQDVETLAGHVDLSGFFDVIPPLPPAAPGKTPPAPASPAAPAAPKPGGLTGSKAPGKLNR